MDVYGELAAWRHFEVETNLKSERRKNVINYILYRQVSTFDHMPHYTFMTRSMFRVQAYFQPTCVQKLMSSQFFVLSTFKAFLFFLIGRPAIIY